MILSPEQSGILPSSWTWGFCLRCCPGQDPSVAGTVCARRGGSGGAAVRVAPEGLDKAHWEGARSRGCLSLQLGTPHGGPESSSAGWSRRPLCVWEGPCLSTVAHSLSPCSPAQGTDWKGLWRGGGAGRLGMGFLGVTPLAP